MVTNKLRILNVAHFISCLEFITLAKPTASFQHSASKLAIQILFSSLIAVLQQQQHMWAVLKSIAIVHHSPCLTEQVLLGNVERALGTGAKRNIKERGLIELGVHIALQFVHTRATLAAWRHFSSVIIFFQVRV